MLRFGKTHGVMVGRNRALLKSDVLVVKQVLLVCVEPVWTGAVASTGER